MHVSRDVDVRVSGVTESEPDGRTGVIFTGGGEDLTQYFTSYHMVPM